MYRVWQDPERGTAQGGARQPAPLSHHERQNEPTQDRLPSRWTYGDCNGCAPPRARPRKYPAGRASKKGGSNMTKFAYQNHKKPHQHCFFGEVPKNESYLLNNKWYIVTVCTCWVPTPGQAPKFHWRWRLFVRLRKYRFLRPSPMQLSSTSGLLGAKPACNRKASPLLL